MFAFAGMALNPRWLTIIGYWREYIEPHPLSIATCQRSAISIQDQQPREAAPLAAVDNLASGETMTRTLYAWRDGGKFYLTAFREPRAHDGKRPAKEYDSETELLEEARQRGCDVSWEEKPDGG